MARYDGLTKALTVAATRGQQDVEMGFEQIEDLIGRPLPPSSAKRHWWANNSQVQALAWRAADFHVEQVSLDRGRVRFARGKVGGTYADRGRVTARPQTRRQSTSRAVAPIERIPTGCPVDVRVHLQWLDAGHVTIDSGGKPAFGPLEEAPGLYCLKLFGGPATSTPRLYIGESDSLRRRLSSNYRNPGQRQKTSLRINALLREHLASGGEVTLAVATTATAWLDGTEQLLNLTRKAGRLLAESAALVLAQATNDAEIVNLG